MKRLVNILFFVLLSIPTAWSGIVLTKSMHLPRVGDEYTKQQLSYVSVGDKGENVVWDFSNAIILDGNHKVYNIQLPDSCIGVIESKNCSRYLLKGDSLLWCGNENRTTILEDSISAIAMKYPLQYGDSAKKSFYFQGRYSTSEKIVSIGYSDVCCDGIGVLYLPDGDTVQNVLRIHLRNKSMVDINDTAIRAAQSDSVFQDFIIKERDCYYWYSSEYRYPLMEVIEDNYFIGNHSKEPYSTIRTAYMCSRSEQDFLFQNNPVDLSMRQQSEKQKQFPKTLFSETEKRDDILPEITEVYAENSMVRINYTTTESINGTEIILCDIQGRLYSTERVNSIIGNNTYIIDDIELPTGEYLLYFRMSDETKVIRFSIK